MIKLKNKKTGEIVSLEGELLFDNEVMLLKQYSSLAELNAEWKDVPEEPKKYWFINPEGEVTSMDEEYEDEEDTKATKEIGNYFSSREEAELAVRKLKAWKRLKDKGIEFTNWEFISVLDGKLVIEAKLNFDNTSSVQKDLEICFGGEE